MDFPVLNNFDESTRNELIELFLSDTETQLEILHKAVAATDQQAVTRTAHSLKGSCANIGAMQMSVLCRQVEQLNKDCDFQQITAVLNLLMEEFGKVRQALEIKHSGREK